MSQAAAMTGPQRKADTFLVSCIDPRLTDDTTYYFAALGRTDRYSEMRIAGAALAALEEVNPAWTQTLFENLAASRELHGIRRVTFLNHRDCGAVNRWAGRDLSADPAEEFRLHTQVLNRAAEAVRARHPDLLIEIKLMELDGAVHGLPCAACAPHRLGAPMDAGSAPRAPQDFTQLARLRSGGRAADRDADLAILTRGVVDYGLTADDALQALDNAAQAQGASTARVVERDTGAFLRSLQDRRGRIARAELMQAAKLYRRLSGARLTATEAQQRTARLAQAEGLAARPEGIWPFRSARWLGRLADGKG